MTDYDQLLAIYDEENACGRTNGFEDELAAALLAALERIHDLEVALLDAIDAFEECTGDYAKELAADDLVRWKAVAGSATPEEDT